MGQNVNLPTTYSPAPEYQYQAPAPAPVNYFADIQTFEDGQRMCKLLAASDLVPQQFRNNVPNVMIALEMAVRTNSSPFQVMQNIYIVHGKPAWSATFIIAALNSCGRFSPLRFEMKGEGDDRVCTAWVIEKGTGERLEGPPVSIEMAKKEGWATKNGSKWATMPELMLRYRAATFFGRLYAPDILMGMRTSDELYDIEANEEMRRRPARRGNDRQPTPAPEPMETSGGPVGVDEINAMLKAEPLTERQQSEQPVILSEAKNPQPVAGDASSPAAPQHDSHEDDAPPEYRAMMGYIAEINGIDDVAALKNWWQRQDYKKLTDELGGAGSEFHKAVAEHVQGRIKELEAAA